MRKLLILLLLSALVACGGSAPTGPELPDPHFLVAADTARVGDVLRLELTVEADVGYAVSGWLRWSNGGADWPDIYRELVVDRPDVYVAPITSSCFLSRWEVDLLSGAEVVASRQGSRFEGDVSA